MLSPPRHRFAYPLPSSSLIPVRSVISCGSGRPGSSKNFKGSLTEQIPPVTALYENDTSDNSMMTSDPKTFPVVSTSTTAPIYSLLSPPSSYFGQGTNRRRTLYDPLASNGSANASKSCPSSIICESVCRCHATTQHSVATSHPLRRNQAAERSCREKNSPKMLYTGSNRADASPPPTLNQPCSIDGFAVIC